MIKKLFKFASLLLSSVALYASGPALNIDSGTITNLTTKNIAVSGTCTGPGCGGGSPGGTGTEVQARLNSTTFQPVPGSSTTATGPIFSSATVTLLATPAIYNPADSGSFAPTAPITLGGNLPYVPNGGCGGHCDIGDPPEVIINPPVVPSAFYIPGVLYPPTLGVMQAGYDPAVNAPAVVLGINVNSNTGMIGLASGVDFLDHQGFYANPSQDGTGTDTFWQLPYPDAAGFWKSDGSKNLSIAPLTSSDMSALLSSTNTWTAQQSWTNSQPSTFTSLSATNLSATSLNATNVSLSGSAGTYGQTLISNGAGAPASWASNPTWAQNSVTAVDFLTSSATWSRSIAPGTTITVECLGAGGAGLSALDGGSGSYYAGGGGEYRRSTFTYVSGTSISVSIGTGGISRCQDGGDTAFNVSGTSVVAKGGKSGCHGGLGGTGGVGQIAFSGGHGGPPNGDYSAGGGGAGGPLGVGGNGGSSGNLNNEAGGGGGGNGGGSNGQNGTNSTGGNGGNNSLGSGSGSGSNGSLAGASGTLGGGGGGGFSNGSPNYQAGNGGGGVEWNSSFGSGGGGGGGWHAGNGGKFGGGGGSTMVSANFFGTGGNGLIVITYTPAGLSPNVLPSQFVVTDSSKNLTTLDLFNSPNTWTAQQNFTSLTAGTLNVGTGSGNAINIQNQSAINFGNNGSIYNDGSGIVIGNGGSIEVDGIEYVSTVTVSGEIILPDGTVIKSTSTILSSTNTWTAQQVITSSFTVATSTQSKYEATFSTKQAGPFHVTISTTGHLNAPAISGSTVTSCGSGASLVGSDIAGTITTGSGSPTACTLTFAQPYTNTPVCVCSAVGPTFCDVTAISNTSFTVLLGVTETTIKYICIGSD